MKNLLLLTVLFLALAGHAKTVYFVRIGGIDCDKLFHNLEAYRDEVGKMYIQLREELEKQGFEVKFTEDAANLVDAYAIFSFNETNRTLLFNLRKYPKTKCFLFVMEPPVVMASLHDSRLNHYFGSIFTLFDDPVDHVTYFKLFYPQPRLKMIANIPEFTKKKLCALIHSNKDSSHPNSLYAERRFAISFLTETGEFDLYGYFWDGYLAWKGTVWNKWETLKNYKFTICYENMKNQRGYITEKIFDAFIAGSVPIYLGADNIADYIPETCFIDRRRFSTYDELYAFMKTMDRTTYESYLTAIRQFLNSSQAALFSVEHFVKCVMNRLMEVGNNANR